VDFEKARNWFHEKGWQTFAFQEEAWAAHSSNINGMVNAPTGSGKTYSLMVPILLDLAKQKLEKSQKKSPRLGAIWVTPIRALAKEILQSGERAIAGMDLNLTIEIRTGDTTAKDKLRIKKSPPDVLITTPESLHVLLTQAHYDIYFGSLSTVVVDEWHDLIGSKRGVQMELVLSKFKALSPSLKIWGISATIGNLEEAMEVLLGDWFTTRPTSMIRSNIKKKYEVESIFPDDLDELPWAGHLGIKLFEKVIPILLSSESTLIFLNTRGQAEIWYQKLLEHSPDFAGVAALHHGSMSRETRHWVEDALHAGKLKAVICTSSLDLGVDFRPVETIIQVGSPKGVSRFMQRAGRSGHQPGATSKIYFLPTHSLELIEAAALREAIDLEMVESRVPYVRSFDVLIQYLVTLAVSNGFKSKELFEEIKSCFSYQSISEEEWKWCLDFIVTGGNSLGTYDEFHKVVIENGLYKVISKRVAMRHRLSIGTIVSDTMLKVKFVTGGFIGNVQESFISRLSPGDTFWFAGRSLELIRVKGLTAQVRKSNKEKGPIPSWNGGRMPLSSQMSKMLRQKMNEAESGKTTDPEITFLKPLIERQKQESILPREDQFLIEQFESRDGHHAIFFPFEGRFVHEGMGALIAYRISLLKPITFSIAMNDYGFELLSDQPIPIKDAIDTNIFSSMHLMDDIYASVNSVEMSRRQFRDIASISGLVFNGFPGKQKKEHHLQASSQLFFEVFNDYEPTNLLLRQSFSEVTDFQLEEQRLRQALDRISKQEIVVTNPKNFTPLSFPIIVDRTRETLTSESLSERIKKMSVV
jgi:ATP-dependent helicase Lhr and Lhr-like helicase